ncbi:MAG: DUF3662 domain-containing protein, partial [Promicromonosporaceae bacterium]|nr:DUF3662 domain-containing protein [Promicromonosporaceae bacterium]
MLNIFGKVLFRLPAIFWQARAARNFDFEGGGMGVLDRFERGVERAMSGAFSKLGRSEVKPVELASRLRRELDDRAVVVG